MVKLLRRYLIGLIVFSFLSGTLCAQIIDSLKHALATSKEDTAKVNLYFRLSSELFNKNNYGECKLYITKGIALAEQINDSQGEAELLRIKGDCYKRNVSYSKALQEYTKALSLEIHSSRKEKIAETQDRLAKLYVETGDYNKALFNLQDELNIYKRIKDTVSMVNVLLDLWDINYRRIANPENAAAYLEKAEGVVSKTTSEELLSDLYYKLGMFFSKAGDYERAAEYHNKSLLLHKKRNELSKVARDYYNIGDLYEKVGNYHKALECYKEILNIRIKLGNKKRLGKAYNNVGWGYQLIGEYKEALDYQLNSYKYYLQSGDSTGIRFPLGNMGIIYNQLGDFNKAIEYSQKAMKLYQKESDPSGVAEANNNIGSAYVNLGEYYKAVEYLNAGLLLAQESHADYEVRNSYKGLALCYEKLVNYKKALEFHKLFSDLEDSLVNKENSDRVSGMNFIIRNEKNQKTIEKARKDKQLDEAKLKWQRTIIYSAVIVVLLTVLLMFYAFRGYRHKRKSNILLRQKNREIQHSYDNIKFISEIGRKIAACLSIEDIIQCVYDNLKTLMDASSFWIGIYNESAQQLDFPLGKEMGRTLPLFNYHLSEDDKIAVYVFKNKKEILINDYLKEYGDYIPGKEIPNSGMCDLPASVICCPLISKGNTANGIIFIQSSKKYAYNEYHLSIIRSLAVFTSIALENALMYQQVEQAVIERTVEVIQQKEEIEKSYSNIKLLSDIGREITSSLHVEEIIENIYKRVNTLIDAPIFLIGIYNSQTNKIDIPSVIESGVKIKAFNFDLNDKTRSAVWCFDNQKELIMNDTITDYNKYFPGNTPPPILGGDDPASLIYYPLTTATRKMGVLSFQSFKKNAYQEYQLDIIRTLVIYIASALENAYLYQSMEGQVKERTAEIESQRDELAKLSAVASETESAIMIADVHSNIEWVNTSFTRLTGYTLEDLKAIGKPSIISISGNPRIREILDDCIKESKSAVYSVMNKSKDGKEIWFQTTLTPVAGKDGEIKNLIAIDSDITDLKNAESELMLQHSIIFEKNKHITDSINYAKRIQDAILPTDEALLTLFRDVFVLYKPKDIVSGDFYWIIEKAEKVFFAVVDCTGHGVPGAFVSIIGHNGLNRCVNEFGLTKPAEILDKLNQLIDEAFGHGHESRIHDGMDIALCSFDRKKRELEFAGANNPLYIISNGELMETKGDKQPIGAFENRKKFNNHSFVLKEEDAVYIFSDGYSDQFGGPLKKKFKYKQFKKTLLSFSKLQMKDQKQALNNTIVDWMGEMEQVDDICVIGMRV